MVTTTLAVLALAGALGTGASPSPSWQTDYSQAISLASAEGKPVAVFIGHGGDKVGRMFADGTIPADAAKLLRESYVSVYINTDTNAGKELSGRFDLPEGLVISSPGGSVQALRHTGSISGPDLTQRLTQYASAGQPTKTTISGVSSSSVIVGGTPAIANYGTPVMISGGCPNGNCPYATPTSGYIYPAGSIPFSTGGCPNGRCPNQR